MIARFAGAFLGLFAFTITVFAGLWIHNPLTVTLSRGILALFLFCILGFVVGGAAQLVIAEHERKREAKIRERFHEEPSGAEKAGSGGETPAGETASTVT